MLGGLRRVLSVARPAAPISVLRSNAIRINSIIMNSQRSGMATDAAPAATAKATPTPTPSAAAVASRPSTAKLASPENATTAQLAAQASALTGLEYARPLTSHSSGRRKAPVGRIAAYRKYEREIPIISPTAGLNLEQQHMLYGAIPVCSNSHHDPIRSDPIHRFDVCVVCDVMRCAVVCGVVCCSVDRQKIRYTNHFYVSHHLLMPVRVKCSRFAAKRLSLATNALRAIPARRKCRVCVMSCPDDCSRA